MSNTNFKISRLKKIKKWIKLLPFFRSIKETILLVYVLLIFSIAYHALYAKRIIPGVKIGSVYVGGKTYDQAKELLKQKEETLDKNLVLTYKDRTYSIKAEDISLTYDWDSSVTRAYEVGRTKNILRDTKEKVVGLLKTLYIGAFYDYDDNALKNEFLIIKGELDQPEEDASFAIEDDNLVIVPSKTGQRINDEELSRIVLVSFDRMDFSEKSVPVRVSQPKITEEDLEKLKDNVSEIVFNDILITFEGEKWKLTNYQKLDLINISRENDLEISINDSKFDAFIDSLELEINELPRAEVTEMDGNRVLDFKITEEGREVDVKKFTEEFKGALFEIKNTVEIPVNKISQLEDKESYGIFALLGEGKSKFNGSSTSRIHNITLAASRTDGVLVPPGGTYSLNDSVGDISYASGYDTAWIIREGRTVLGEGGGVCQVSTTLFRAILNSGLPIVMRYPHAYRVGYYEIDSPVGFDASIFQPSIDLRFKNDTSAYVLVESATDVSTLSLTFRIYGTPDGRTVEITDPVVTNQTPPPDPLYQDDPTLAKGVTKQVDFAAWGANVSFSRVVKKDGNILHESTFSSVYKPWQAVYLVGTKEY